MQDIKTLDNISSLLVSLRHRNDSVTEYEIGEKTEKAFVIVPTSKHWRKRTPKDVLYTHYGQINVIKQSSICITYNPRNKTLTGSGSRVRESVHCNSFSKCELLIGCIFQMTFVFQLPTEVYGAKIVVHDKNQGGRLIH